MRDSGRVNRVALFALHSSPLARLGTEDAGGMNRYVRQLALGLQGLGIQADIFTRRTDPDLPASMVLEGGTRLVHLNGGPPERVPKHLLPLHVPALAKSFRDFAREVQLTYDILHSHYWLSALVALRARVDSETPLVHMFHTLSTVKEHYAGELDPADSALREDAERCIIERAHAIVGATSEELDDIERFYAPIGGLSAVIPPGVDTQIFRPIEKARARQALDIKGGPVVLFVGRLETLKGLDRLLESIAQLRGRGEKGIKLLVLGEHGKRSIGGQANYLRLVKTLKIDSHVEFRGTVDEGQLPLYYSAADICAMPSFYESFGMVAIESMACETPVVAFNVGGLAATIEHHRTGFLAPHGDLQGFTDTLMEALKSDLPRIGARARLSVQFRNWQDVASRTAQLYQQLAQEQQYSYALAAGGC